MTYAYQDPARSGFKIVGLITPKPRYRAGSLPVGTCEHRVALALKPSVLANLVLTARLTDRLSRKPGCRNGDLGHVTLEAFDWLRTHMKGGDGFVAHAFSYIAKAIRRSRSTVVEGVHRLVDAGCSRGSSASRASHHAYDFQILSPVVSLWNTTPIRDGRLVGRSVGRSVCRSVNTSVSQAVSRIIHQANVFKAKRWT